MYVQPGYPLFFFSASYLLGSIFFSFFLLSMMKEPEVVRMNTTQTRMRVRNMFREKGSKEKRKQWGSQVFFSSSQLLNFSILYFILVVFWRLLVLRWEGGSRSGISKLIEWAFEQFVVLGCYIRTHRQSHAATPPPRLSWAPPERARLGLGLSESEGLEPEGWLLEPPVADDFLPGCLTSSDPITDVSIHKTATSLSHSDIIS